jgi:hypothetical protein
MEAVMIDRFQVARAAMTALGLGALMPMPALATDDVHPSLLNALMGASPQPDRVQLADTVQSTGSSSSSASSSSSSSVTVTGGKQQGKCTAEASAHAQADGVEDSDHDLKVVEGNGCSASSESRAVVKPQQKQPSE